MLKIENEGKNKNYNKDEEEDRRRETEIKMESKDEVEHKNTGNEGTNLTIKREKGTYAYARLINILLITIENVINTP